MSMTKSDFEAVANAIRNDEAEPEVREHMASVMAGVFATRNPNFNRTMFLHACGVTT